MRSLLIVAICFPTSCASHLSEPVANTLVGTYKMGLGPDAWSEIDLEPGGTCVCSSCSAVGGLLRWGYTACWSWQVDGSFVSIDVQDEAMFSWRGPRRLVVRQWDGYSYLVPPDEVDWFDKYGPLNECCFARDSAPMGVWRSERRAN